MNCAAIPKDLLESELFGHERGAFTGATARHLGYAERARDGILFLDEIGELDLKLQAKLLRLLEDRSFHRVGGEAPVPFAGRLVCATNADLTRRVQEGTFREDLLYRINVLTVSIPPLRERPGGHGMAGRAVRRGPRRRRRRRALGPQRPRRLAKSVRMRGRATSANCATGSSGRSPSRRDLGSRPATSSRTAPATAKPEATAASLEGVRDEAERREILNALRRNDGVIGKAAAALGISRTTMWEKMRRHRIEATKLD